MAAKSKSKKLFVYATETFSENAMKRSIQGSYSTGDVIWEVAMVRKFKIADNDGKMILQEVK